MSIGLSQLHLDWGSSRYKGKVYRSYSLARALWVDGKNKKKTVIKLGKLSDAEVIQWRNLLKALKKPECFLTSFEDICTEKHYAYLDIAIATAIWDEWGLDVVFKNGGKRLVSIATVARILTVNRCIDPAAKSKTPEWFRETALPWMVTVHSPLIFFEKSENSSRQMISDIVSYLRNGSFNLKFPGQNNSNLLISK